MLTASGVHQTDNLRFIWLIKHMTLGFIRKSGKNCTFQAGRIHVASQHLTQIQRILVPQTQD
jgi:hypothetical protein